MPTIVCTCGGVGWRRLASANAAPGRCHLRVVGERLAFAPGTLVMALAHETHGPGDASFRRAQNVLLVAQHRIRWPKSDELQRALAELRTAYPDGSAVLNLLAGREGARMREAWGRLSVLFLFGGNPEGARHLGTAHLFEPVGLREMPLRLAFRVVERRGGDFPRHGNKIVSTADEAADWLAGRLAGGPVKWNRDELRDTIAAFVRRQSAPLCATIRSPL
jgi:hypothetical protein